MEVPEVANMVTIDDADFPMHQDIPTTYQELKCTNEMENLTVLSCDQGYESGGSRTPEHAITAPVVTSYGVCSTNDISTVSYPDAGFADFFDSPYQPYASQGLDFGYMKPEPSDPVFTTSLPFYNALDEVFPPVSQSQMLPPTEQRVIVQQQQEVNFATDLYFNRPTVDADQRQYDLSAATEAELSCGSDSGYSGSNFGEAVKVEPVVAMDTAKPKRQSKRSSQPILWKFLLDALNHPETYAGMIHWVNKEEGSFQFTSAHKEELSKEWGKAKNNRCVMTYQKMARALRNYINKGQVLRKVKKKLQYTFLPEFYEGIADQVR